MHRPPDSRRWHFQRSGKLLRTSFFLEFIGPFLLCVAIYYCLFAASFLRQDIVMGGDTQLIWSFLYFNIYSILHFHEFAWWDPTALNGWPSYLYALSVYASYLSPYTLPILGFAAVGHALGLSINTILILHLTLISYALNLFAVMLISRELIQHPLARFLPALIFTISEISFHGFRDAWLYASMPPALFYLYGLVHYNNRRTPAAFILFVFLTGAFLASLNYALMQSSLYWTLAFTLLLLVFFPDLPRTTWLVLRQIWLTRTGRALLALGLLLWICAFAAFFTPMWFNLGDVVRISGSRALDYAPGVSGDFNKWSIFSWPAWTSFLMWSPMPELHDSVLKFDPWGAGIDHRYLGMITLPLLFVALLRATEDRYVLVIFMTFAVCTFFIVYTVQNLALLPFIDNFSIFENIRTMSNIMPREGPSIMIMLLSGLGLDALIRISVDKPRGVSYVTRPFVAALLLGFVALGIVLGVLGASKLGEAVRGPLTHMSIYLAFGALLCLLLLFAPTERARPICIAVLILSFLDLTISASMYWKRGKVWFDNKGPHQYPQPAGIGPISAPEENWAGGYRGFIHNLAGGPIYGLKTWLVLATRPQWQPALTNWNPQTLMMRAYPSFQFASNAEYVPFETISKIDSMPVPGHVDPSYRLSADAKSLVAPDGSVVPILSGNDLVGSVDSAARKAGGVELSGWAIDLKAKTTPRSILIFADRPLWTHGIKTGNDRPDIATGLGSNYRWSGFSVMAHDLTADQNIAIRAFALMHDQTARELQYSPAFPFFPAGEKLQAFVILEPRGRASAPLYIHDQAAKSGLPAKGEFLEDVPISILKFTPNTVRVRVNPPSDVLMVSNDNYDRFWTATVDGSRVPIYRANYTYKAVRLPAGEHVVEWRYNPWPVKIMWGLFYAVLAAFAGVWFLWHRRSWPRPVLAEGAMPEQGAVGQAGNAGARLTV
jgi:hypothetical protein